MAAGTSGGLLDDLHAQSVFKHEILRQYMAPFIAMPGSTAEGNQVVVLDGFAGRGRYQDGSPGSAELILQAIQAFRGSRNVTGFFVEKDPALYPSLQGVVEEYVETGVRSQAFLGAVEDHLNIVIRQAVSSPLFLFLDPCGAGLPFRRLVDVLVGPRQATRPQTEVLLNFSADLSRRAAGALKKNQLDHPIIGRMDTACGGDWWRSMALEALRHSVKGNFEPVTHVIAAEYAQRLAAASSMLPVVVSVRRRLHHQPIYHLVFLTRSPYGLWVFADASGKARQVYLRALGKLDDDDETGDMLFTPTDSMEWLIDGEKDKALKIVTANIRALVQ
ncbi:three-Cys-motif partner protein TcmP [Microtetraspora glauca]|uniref:Three-Cys-motif partner protein TcmP n=1 Tax=Microtetraspora glauca TaxID=1996 RepID=A0ABV3GM00_MICGL